MTPAEAVNWMSLLGEAEAVIGVIVGFFIGRAYQRRIVREGESK